MSRFSMVSASSAAARQNNNAALSTTTLLNHLYTSYSSLTPFPLESSTSLSVSTWLTLSQAASADEVPGPVDAELGRRAWEHARRRAEDGCVVLGYLHPSCPPLLEQFLRALPVQSPELLTTAIAALRPFVSAVTPQNAYTQLYSSLAVKLTLALTGNIIGASISISSSGLDTSVLTDLSDQPGHRAFDVFYYLLTSASTPAEREFLGLKDAASYDLLHKSGTYAPPAYIPSADDGAAAEDFRTALKSLGIKGSKQRNLLSALAALLKLGNTVGLLVSDDAVEEICEDVGALLGIDPETLVKQLGSREREILIAVLYESLVDWVLQQANAALAAEMQRIKAQLPADSDDTVCLTILDVPGEKLGKAIALSEVFDDSVGIAAEMRADGIELPPPGVSMTKEAAAAIAEVEANFGVENSAAYRNREIELDQRREIFEKVGVVAEADGILSTLFNTRATSSRFDLLSVLRSSRVWFHLSIHPTDDAPSTLASLPSTTSSWFAGTISRQLRAWRLPEWANRRNKLMDFTADFDVEEFCIRYAPLGCKEGRDGVEVWILERGWSNGDVVIGHDRIWMREAAWWDAEGMLDLKPVQDTIALPSDPYLSAQPSYFAPQMGGTDLYPPASRDHLIEPGSHGTPSLVHSAPKGDYGLGNKGDEKSGAQYYQTYDGELKDATDPELANARLVGKASISFGRRVWIAIVWALTFWIPSPALRYIGRMKRPDVRMAWREKFVLVLIILLLNGLVVFYIIGFGKLLCPNFDSAWNQKEVGYHKGDHDFWVSVRGKVYDISKYWKVTHSDTNIQVSEQVVQPLGGMDLTEYFPLPVSWACPGLNVDASVTLQPNTSSVPTAPQAVHTSGPLQPDILSQLYHVNWYETNFLKTMKGFYKGDLVWDPKDVFNQGQNEGRQWFILNNKIYDLTDYFFTQAQMANLPSYHFLNSDVENLIKTNPGLDITDSWNLKSDNRTWTNNLNCINNLFYTGKTDFRLTPRCQVNNYLLLSFTIVLCVVILVKFLAALQLGSKRRPSPQDKFVICQVPAYTEGEDQLRKALDSLTALQYDNKRKLICVICDGVIVGSGNDRPTPKIVLDILGVDPKVDPPALPFKSVGQGAEQLNYGKVYSGLYEYEGNVVPYVVVVKVGRQSEQSNPKPGNRGKRDSQVLLLSFLNRVHHRSPMSPLELEMFHQINNVIGVDPELYEYLLMVDADTSVKEDSLTRLVASCANDAKIAGICGETSLENEQKSPWTMIQVYEYYISHHLAKAFESLFGSVTCLPGCFCMYRLRTADRGKPLIISDKVISEYSDGEVDTLHKKNLLALGEDRYLTTLMTKHFPSMSYKFIPDAYALTAAPETWSVLLSQRRRWINSTIHNLAELVWLKDMCGFCCFGMRFVVFIDLFGTIILPATCAYLGYLIYKVATHSGQLPIVSIIMIAAVYGLQAIIFIIKRQWQHIGWMIIYILAYPIYSFILPIYSFWNQDNFTWGNTRIVIGEKGSKKILSLEGEEFDPRAIPLQAWDDYASKNNLPGRRAPSFEKGGFDDMGYEMDDMRSVYSTAKPASTILTGFGRGAIPPSPAPYASLNNRQSSYSLARPDSTYNMRPSPVGTPGPTQSVENLLPAHIRQSRMSMAGGPSRESFVDFSRHAAGPDDATVIEAIKACLQEVDLETVTKKQVRHFVEQRLQTELNGERRAFLDRQIDAELAAM